MEFQWILVGTTSLQQCKISKEQQARWNAFWNGEYLGVAFED